MTMHFRLFDNHDEPYEPDEWTFNAEPVAGRWDTLDTALRAATLRALQLADDPYCGVHSVKVTMFDEELGYGMTLASIHVWSELHRSGLPWLPHLRAHLEPITEPRRVS